MKNQINELLQKVTCFLRVSKLIKIIQLIFVFQVNENMQIQLAASSSDHSSEI
jgi:hypothetical protein